MKTKRTKASLTKGLTVGVAAQRVAKLAKLGVKASIVPDGSKFRIELPTAPRRIGLLTSRRSSLGEVRTAVTPQRKAKKRKTRVLIASLRKKPVKKRVVKKITRKSSAKKKKKAARRR